MYFVWYPLLFHCHAESLQVVWYVPTAELDQVTFTRLTEQQVSVLNRSNILDPTRSRGDINQVREGSLEGMHCSMLACPAFY
jgi:hypothetical protein